MKNVKWKIYSNLKTILEKKKQCKLILMCTINGTNKLYKNVESLRILTHNTCTPYYTESILCLKLQSHAMANLSYFYNVFIIVGTIAN